MQVIINKVRFIGEQTLAAPSIGLAGGGGSSTVRNLFFRKHHRNEWRLGSAKPQTWTGRLAAESRTTLSRKSYGMVSFWKTLILCIQAVERTTFLGTKCKYPSLPARFVGSTPTTSNTGLTGQEQEATDFSLVPHATIGVHSVELR